VVKDVLGGILGGSKKDTLITTKDSIPTKKDTLPTNVEEVVEEKAKDILGGLFGRKKKKDSVQKDSLN